MAAPLNSEPKSSSVRSRPWLSGLSPSPQQPAMPESMNWCNCKHLLYNGVQKRSWGKWVSRIHEPGKNLGEIWLGSFSIAEMAVRAHDAAALAIKGNFAILNFPELAPFLPRAGSSFRDDVKAAAAKAASMTSFSVSADAATPSPLDALSLPISSPRTLSSCSSSLLSSSCTDNVSTLEELGEILGKIVELPRLGAIYECKPMMSDVMNNLVYSDLNMWADPFGDQMNSMESGIGSSF